LKVVGSQDRSCIIEIDGSAIFLYVKAKSCGAIGVTQAATSFSFAEPFATGDAAPCGFAIVEDACAVVLS
jgi:hypothetical protein